jgi:hypothetical protein
VNLPKNSGPTDAEPGTMKRTTYSWSQGSMNLLEKCFEYCRTCSSVHSPYPNIASNRGRVCDRLVATSVMSWFWWSDGCEIFNARQIVRPVYICVVYLRNSGLIPKAEATITISSNWSNNNKQRLVIVLSIPQRV